VDRQPPVLAPLALGNQSTVRNWIEEEQGSVFFGTGSTIFKNRNPQNTYTTPTPQITLILSNQRFVLSSLLQLRKDSLRSLQI